MLINLKYFASVREALGGGEQVVMPDGVETVGDVRAWLRHRGEPWASALAEGRALRMACNQRMCDAAAAVAPGDEIAFFPPVTGG
ncbi:molybdopterin converting factor subunit 1 [Pseudoduganella violaceinigra]|uniref:molybdopterin converting factor subunit 1 n=1 Tax=Pseudoduganella violaceinigra TaxID=246602 RepID=UPI0004191366|nr:molybdopterin converting factor subunit 1 [Pseudoduganella violaceinigra]